MNSPLGDAEESSIREIIAQYYSVVHAMIVLRDFVSEQPGIENTARENVLSQLRFLESQYKESQEWIMTRDVQDIHMGVIGTAESMKTALVTMYCTLKECWT